MIGQILSVSYHLSLYLSLSAYLSFPVFVFLFLENIFCLIFCLFEPLAWSHFELINFDQIKSICAIFRSAFLYLGNSYW
jgi:hypothetical protein